MNQSVGLIEIKGLAGAIEVADTMLKVAVVELLKLEKAKGFGWMTIIISGDVAAVQAAIDAGKSQAIASNCFVTSLVIPRPGVGLESLFVKKISEQPMEKESTPEEKAEKKVDKIAESVTQKETASTKKTSKKEKKNN